MPDDIPAAYRSHTPRQALGHLIEECGEVLAAAGKTLRFGWDSFNPELPEDQRETNLAWLLRELADLDRAILAFRRSLQPAPSAEGEG